MNFLVHFCGLSVNVIVSRIFFGSYDEVKVSAN